jgi:hypothetical protein
MRRPDVALNLRELAESDKVVVIGSSLLLELLDRLDALEAGATVDAAWAEVEAALPDGWYVGNLSNRPYINEPRRVWLAQAYEPDERMAFTAGFGDTPAAALRALAEKLRERQS